MKDFMKLYVYVACIITACSSITAITYNPHNTVVIVDQKYVLSEHSRPGVKDFKVLAQGKTIKKLPTIMYLLTFKFKKIKKRGFEIAQHTKGTANIVHEVLQWMKHKKYGDLTSLESTIIQASIPAHPRKDVIDLCKQLKQKGCRVYADSDMDTIHAEVHAHKMKKLTCDISWLDGSITLTPYDIARRAVRHHYSDYKELAFNQFVVNYNKYQPERYTLTHTIVGNDKEILFIVRDAKTAQIVRNAGFDAIAFTSANQLRSELRSRELL